MQSRVPSAVFATVVVVTLVGGAVSLPLASAASPTISVAVDGTTLAEGESTLVQDNPQIDVSVDAAQSIQVVSVRVDGTTRHRATPNATTFDDAFDLSLSSGEHAVTVVVKTDTVTTYTVTVTKDAGRPYVRYTSPFDTEQFASPPDETTVNRSRVVLGGNFTDVTGVSHLRIVRQTEYSVGEETRTDRQTYSDSVTGDSFAQPILLGVGRNNITAKYYDRLGHVRTHTFRLFVEDTAPPTLSNLSVVRRSPERLDIRGLATDNGQIRHVAVHPPDGVGTTYLVEPSLGRPDPERQRVSFETTRSLYPGTTAIVIEATDTAGNTVERTVSVQRNVAPELRLNPTGTRFVDADTVVVRGRATDGEIASATVETVDPETGEVVDIASVHDGTVVTDLAVERRLDAPDGREATLRLRVIDSAGNEHVVSVNRTLTVETPTATVTPTPTATVTPTPTVAPTPTATPTATPVPDSEGSSGVTVPFLGVTIPVPSLLGASVSVPVPVVGPFDVPLAPVAALAALGVGIVARVR